MKWFLLLASAASALMAPGVFAAIPVRIDGSDVWTFDALPAPAEWSTRSIGSSSSEYYGENAVMQLESALQVFGANDITNAVTSTAANPAGQSTTAKWSSTGRYLQTQSANNGATLLMAALSNSAAVEILAFDARYDFAVAVTPLNEELPGHRIYYSLSGTPASWVSITNFTTAGQQTFTLWIPGSWHPGSTIYLLFVDDNAIANPDGAYQIDNFRVMNVIHGDPSCVGITGQPQSITVPERGMAAFSLMATGSPQRIQWYRSDDAGVSYNPIAGANGTDYAIASATFPNDNGARFQVTVSNSLCVVTSSVAILTVNPDTNPPTVVRARGELSSDSILLTFSEEINPLAVSPDNFILFETGTDPALSFYITLDASVVNGTDVMLLTDSREPGKNYSVRILYLEDASSQANPIVPANVPLRQAIQLIGFDTDNEWKYDINNGDRFGTGWEAPWYDDSTWPSGLAGLGFDSSADFNGVPIRTQLSYPGNSVPVYFRRHFILPGTNEVMLTLREVVDDGAVYFINGQEVFRRNVAQGPLTFATRATAGQIDPTPIQGPFTLPATNLLPGDNVIAVAVFQSGAASGDIAFAAELSAEINSICSCALRILVQPRSYDPREGESFALTVVVEGAVPLYYQWRKNGVNIPGATNATLYFASAGWCDAGSYDVVASNSQGSVTSMAASVLMEAPLPQTTISRHATTGEITIHWSGCGTLQQTTGEPDHDVFASWENVPGNPNPYTFTPTGRGKFFRVRP